MSTRRRTTSTSSTTGKSTTTGTSGRSGPSTTDSTGTSGHGRPTPVSPALRTGTFTCARCGLTVTVLDPHDRRRNHCPSCLTSLHVHDQVEGGRSECEGRMAPISIAVLRTGDWTVVHRCSRCGELSSEPVSPDDNQLILMRMAVRPLAQPPFPLEAFGEL